MEPNWEQIFQTLFPASGAFEFISIDIFEPFSNTDQSNQYTLAITNRYSKLTRAVLMPKIAALQTVNLFADHWLTLFDKPVCLAINNKTQFVSSFFAAPRGLLRIKREAITAYRPQTNNQGQRFSKTIHTCLWHYGAEHQNDWDTFLQQLPYAYSTLVHHSTNLPPFSFFFSLRAPRIILPETDNALSADI